jgi:hypothetical protein
MQKLNKKELKLEQREALLETLKIRFEKNNYRHKNIEWKNVHEKLEANTDKLWSINRMEETGGEPDVVAYNNNTNEYIFYDCASESPKDRRSLCYDNEALAARKKFKPKNSALGMATEMGIELLTEDQYRELQKLGTFDTKTSSWLKTPEHIRNLGGAIFGDFRFDTVFVYHNGAESYYGGRGFRGIVSV